MCCELWSWRDWCVKAELTDPYSMQRLWRCGSFYSQSYKNIPGINLTQYLPEDDSKLQLRGIFCFYRNLQTSYGYFFKTGCSVMFGKILHYQTFQKLCHMQHIVAVNAVSFYAQCPGDKNSFPRRSVWFDKSFNWCLAGSLSCSVSFWSRFGFAPMKVFVQLSLRYVTITLDIILHR